MTTDAKTHEASEMPQNAFTANILGAFSRALSDKMDEAVQEAVGLSTSACYAIVQAGAEPNASIEKLRRMLSLEHSSVVRVIDRLEGQDIMVRVRGSSGDRREVSIALTDKGEDYLTRILDARREVLNRIVDLLSEDDKHSLVGLVKKMMPGAVIAGDDQHYVCRLCDLEVCPQEECPVNCAHPDHYEHPEKPFRRKHSHARQDG
jgi:MarR family transcriptional regulator, negative regulator of the multidrug operon emrRAB